jgi:hypothetical protein
MFGADELLSCELLAMSYEILTSYLTIGLEARS